MAAVSERGRITFGFKNVNGRAFNLKIIDSPRGTFLTKLTVPTLRNRTVAIMNKHGREAERIAKSPGHSPYLTGLLVSTIVWRSAKRRRFSGLVLGQLEVGVVYGRVQEYTHKTRAFYLHRAMMQVYPGFISDLQDAGAIEDILLGRKTQPTIGRYAGSDL